MFSGIILEKELKMIVDKVTIFAPQDPSVGLFPTWITIDFGGYETDELD